MGGVQSKSLNSAYNLTKDDKQKLLLLSMEKYDNIELGQYIPKKDAQNAPKLALPAGFPVKADSLYTVIALDGDAPTRSVQVLGPVLHWIQPNLTIDTSTAKKGEPIPLVVHEQHKGKHITDYIAPAPPLPGTPHRYAFMLFEQPKDVDFSSLLISEPFGMSKRVRYNSDEFEKKYKLGPYIAANYFTSN